MIEQSSGHVQIQFFGSKFKFSIFYNFFFPSSSPSSCRLFSASAGKGLKCCSGQEVHVRLILQLFQF